MGTQEDRDMNDISNGAESVLALLQPIRDLGKNWDIDIASCLGEYLEELEGTLTNEDRSRLLKNGISENLNFAKAALVLQNSSNIYSRKVEYLYSLVYKTLNDLSEASGETSGSRKGKTPVPEDIDAFLNFDRKQEFLLLDHVLPTDDTDNCQKINLKERENDPSATGYTNVTSAGRSRYSLGATNLTTVTTDRSASSVNAAANRALLGTLDTTSLRLVGGKCDVAENGLLVLPGTTSNRRVSTPSIGEALGSPSAQSFLAPNEADSGDYDDDHEDGGGFAMAENDAFVNFDEEPQVENDLETTHLSHQQKKVSFVLPPMARKEPLADPWALLDQHVSEKQKIRPLRIGKTIRLPQGINEPPSECVTGTRTRRSGRRLEALFVQEKPTISSLGYAIFKANFAEGKRHSVDQNIQDDAVEIDQPSVPFRGLAFGDEFAYVAKATAKRLAVQRRKKQKDLEQQATVERGDYLEEEDDDDGGGFFFGGEDDNDIDDAVVEEAYASGNTGMSSLDDAFAHRVGEGDLGTDEGQTFEDLCRAHTAAFAKDALKYASETQLTKRVNYWQERLAPMLEAEESRAVFDIRSYSATVVQSIESEIQRQNPSSDDSCKKASRVLFSDVTRKMPPYEVCRMFLATLSLSNSGNIYLDEKTNLLVDNNLTLELRNSNIETPMENYLAPSVLGLQDLEA